jgi:hypothetical protein
MAIDGNQIDTDITLELDEEEISIEDFANAFGHFAGLIKELSKQVSPKKHASAWNVKVYSGSAGIGLSKKLGVLTAEEVNIVRSNLIEGLAQLERGDRPSMFTDKAIEHSKGLALLFKKKKGVSRVRIWDRNRPAVTIDRVLVSRAEAILDANYEDQGSVDGFLEKISAHNQFEFVIYDVIDNRPIRCEVDESHLKAAWESFRKRVEVLGRVRYRKDGLPVSVAAREIIAFPPLDAIPSPAEMRRLLGEE